MAESLQDLLARRAEAQEYRPRIPVDGRVRAKALASLVVGALAIAGFVIGLRHALARIPAQPTAAQADSVRADRAAQAAGPAAPGAESRGPRRQPDELPRLR